MRDHILPYDPSSVLEVGCNSGVTLRLLEKTGPALRLAGVDINATSIAIGRALSPEIDLRAGTARLLPFGDASYDVVFTDACLIYVGPNDIRRVLEECRRVARLAVVVREWNTHREAAQNFRGCWLHNWAKLGANPVTPAYPQSPEWEEWGMIGHFRKNPGG